MKVSEIWGRGMLHFSQIWALPLTSKNDVSIDAIAVAVNAELQKSSEKSFVSDKATPEDAKNKLRLDILLIDFQLLYYRFSLLQ